MSKSCVNYNMMTWDLEVGYMQQRKQRPRAKEAKRTNLQTIIVRPQTSEREE